MALACIDTQILIWGIQRVATAGQEEMITRAHTLLSQLEKDRTPVIVPSIVIGEFLLGLPVDEHPRYQELVTRQFMVMPYDLRASIQFSRIWHQKHDENVIEEIKRTGLTRTELRADTMIVALAATAVATIIYGHDQGVRRLASGVIEFQDLADLSAI